MLVKIVLVVAEKALNGKTEDDDEKMGCFAACMAKKVGLVNIYFFEIRI